MQNDSLKEWALKYAEMGLYVFPLIPRQKDPATAHGFKDSSNDKAQIGKWWDECPDYNIGLATGVEYSGLVVIDLDRNHREGEDGYETLKDWQRENGGELPETWTSITGQGGYHLIYVDNRPHGSRRGLYEGVDVKGEGGYIVAPPSVHPDTGRKYEWEQGPGDCEIAQADSRVRNFLLGPMPEGKRAFSSPKTIPEGERTNTLIKLIGLLRRRGLDDGAIRAAVVAENEAKCAPPLTEQELEKTIFPALKRDWKVEKPYAAVGGEKEDAASKDGLAYKKHFLELLELLEKGKPKISAFNPKWLPPAISRFTERLKEILQVSREMVSPAAITACSLGVQKKYCAHPLPDWYEPANIYMVVIAEASERKSPAMKEIAEPIYEYEQEENERIAPEVAAYEAKKKILEKKIEGAIKGMASNHKKDTDKKYLDMGDLDAYQHELVELEEVAPIRLVVDDVTVEVLGLLMERNQERMGIMSTEGGIFNILAGRYNDKVLIDIILKGYSGDRLVQARINRPGLELRHPLITMLLYVQPVVIEEIMDNCEFVRRGLNARFLYVIPPSTIGERSYRVQKMPENVKKDYSDIIRRLFAIPVPDKPKPVALSGEADELAEKFFYEVEGLMKDASPELKAWYGKLHGTTIRIALTLHCMQHIEQSEFYEISGETMQNAIEMAGFFQSHAEAAFDIMGLADPPEVRDAKRILKIIDSMGKVEFPLSELLQKCKPKKGLEKREDVIPGLNCLTEHGYIRIWPVHPANNSNNSNKRGRPSEIVYVNPEYIKRRERRNGKI